jgi:hypothetical protein
MADEMKKKKVLCPVERGGKTYWKTLGMAFVNKDNSINVYLDGLPWNGKLHLRDFDERDEARRDAAPGTQFGLRALPPPPPMLGPPNPAGDELPF